MSILPNILLKILVWRFHFREITTYQFFLLISGVGRLVQHVHAIWNHLDHGANSRHVLRNWAIWCKTVSRRTSEYWSDRTVCLYEEPKLTPAGNKLRPCQKKIAIYQQGGVNMHLPENCSFNFNSFGSWWSFKLKTNLHKWNDDWSLAVHSRI